MACRRVNSDPAAEEAARRAVVALRLACKIPRTAFALMIGMGPQALSQKEKGRLRFRPEEVARIKDRVAAHLSDAHSALQTLSV